jgi:hypothetical protein
MTYIKKGASKILRENTYIKTEPKIEKMSFQQSKKELVAALFNNWELNFIEAERYLRL